MGDVFFEVDVGFEFQWYVGECVFEDVLCGGVVVGEEFLGYLGVIDDEVVVKGVEYLRDGGYVVD